MPLMLCVMLASTLGGRVMSTHGADRPTRDRRSPAARRRHRRDVPHDRAPPPLLVPSLCAAVVGLGIGLTTPAHMVVVQNSVGEDRLGAATSTTQFTRKIGSTIGVALLGGLFNERVADALEATWALPPGTDADSLLQSPAQIAQLPAEVGDAVRQAVAEGATVTFLAAFVVAAIGPRCRSGSRTTSSPTARCRWARRPRWHQDEGHGVPRPEPERAVVDGLSLWRCGPATVCGGTCLRRRCCGTCPSWCWRQRAAGVGGQLVHRDPVEPVADDLPAVAGVVAAQQPRPGAEVDAVGGVDGEAVQLRIVEATRPGWPARHVRPPSDERRMHYRWAPAIIVPPPVSRTRYTVIGSWSVADHERPPSIDRKTPPLFSPSTTSPHAARSPQFAASRARRTPSGTAVPRRTAATSRRHRRGERRRGPACRRAARRARARRPEHPLTVEPAAGPRPAPARRRPHAVVGTHHDVTGPSEADVERRSPDVVVAERLPRSSIVDRTERTATPAGDRRRVGRARRRRTTRPRSSRCRPASTLRRPPTPPTHPRSSPPGPGGRR